MSCSRLRDLTLSELLQIASFGKQAESLTLEFSNFLGAAVNVLSPKWVRTFIFSQSPLHIQHLLSPTLSVNALLLQDEHTHVEQHVPTPLVASGIGVITSVKGHVLYIPVFTGGSITVGFGVHHGSSEKAQPGIASDIETAAIGLNFRFVLDSQHKILMLTSYLHGAILIVLRRLFSTTLGSYSFGLFPSELCQTLTTADQISRDDMQGNLFCVSQTLFRHRCTVCGEDGKEGHSCDFDDFDSSCTLEQNRAAFERKMNHFAWNSIGSTIRQFLGPTKEPKVSTSGFRMGFKIIRDLDTLDQVRAWSIWEFAHGLNESPRSSEPFLRAMNSILTARKQNISGSQSRGEDIVRARKGDVTTLHDRVGKGSRVSTASKALPNSSDGSNGREHDQQEMLQVFEEPSFGMALSHTAACMPPCLLKYSEQIIIAKTSASENSMEARQQEKASGESNQPKSSDDRIPQGHKETVVKPTKQDIRREKNRLAARRSNQKKKAYARRLELDLSALTSRVSDLRTREHKLRQENMTLRQKLFAEANS